MAELTVINGIKKEKPNYREIYGEAFTNTLEKEISENGVGGFETIDLDTRRKLILYGVKYVNENETEKFDYDLLRHTFTLISLLNEMMSTLTPREFETIFPISKEYDGKKYGVKDYFYTKNRIEEFGMDKVIGEEMELLHWDYQNWELASFATQTLCVMSAIRRAEGGKGIMEEFLEEHSVTTYTATVDDKGNKLLTNNDTGEVLKVDKPKPKYLKVLK